MSRTESLSDADARTVAAAEADLDRLLALEPSAEFTARVRSRIAEGRPSRHRYWAWLAVPIAAAAAVLVAVSLRNDAVPAEESVPRAATAPHADIVLARPPRIEASVALRRRPPAPIRTSTRLVAAPLAAEPEIIVDPSFAAAIRRMALSPPPPSDSTLINVEPVAAGEPQALSVGAPLDVPELVLKPADQDGGQ